ncbi:hypothetical protein JCM8115_002857 [Rhodotorula mucilaginosa]
MSTGPSTPSSGAKGANALGRFLNKLRTPSSGDSPSSNGNVAHDEPQRPPSRSSSPFGSLMGRRSSSRASVRTHDSAHPGASAPLPPFPASLNASSLSLASKYPSLDAQDDADLSFPEFETNPFGLSPSSTSLASTSSAAAAAGGGPFGEATLQPRPPTTRPGTSLSTRSRSDTVDPDRAALARGWPGSLSTSTSANATNPSKESLGMSSRSLGKSLLGKRKEAAGQEETAAEGTQKSTSRLPSTRLTSDDPLRAFATTTPGVGREALSSSTASTDPRRLFGAARSTGTTGMRRARRVVQTAQPAPSTDENVSTPESQGTLADSERSATSASAGDGGGGSDDSPVLAPEPVAVRSSREPSSEPNAFRKSASAGTNAGPAPSAPMQPRPPISPNAHGRSRSELPPSSPRMVAPIERNASTVTINSRDPGTSVSSASERCQEESVTSPPEAGGSAGSASLYLSRGRTQPSATSGSQQPLGSTAFRNRFLNSSSTSSLSSATNSPELGSISHLSTSSSATSANPTPPNANAPAGPAQPVAGGGFKLAPLGSKTGLSRKPSISMLSAVAEDRHAPAPAARQTGVVDTRYDPLRDRTVKPTIATESTHPNADERRASPSRESEGMVPYAHRRTASRTIGPGDSSVMSEAMSTGSGTHGGTTTLVNTANGGGSLKRSNSETVTQGLMGPPVTRPASGMSLYRDEPVQQPPTRPAVARVPSGRQVLAERPTVAEVHVPEPAQESYHPGQADQQQQQPLPPSFQPYHDENAYDSRAPYGLPDGPLPPPPPSTSLPQQSGHRPVLAEVNRGYAQPQAPSTQQRTAAPLYGLQTAQKTGGEYQMPLRDRSPGLAEATPSATVQQGHYQSQQAYQQRQQQQMQHAPQYQQQQQPTQMQAPGVSFAPAPEQPTVERKMSKPIIVNGRVYHRLGILGRGGSSKVYRVTTERNDLLALKRVDTRNDSESRASFINEITLLRKLAGKPEIIQLVDSEIQGKYVVMVMEAGETDLNTLLASYAGKPISLNFIRYIWEQMLSAVQVIHDEAVVHSDLKPANFVLVKGRLKLIDFGISKAIAGDTTNIGRDQQIGTANYMPPEALNDTGLGLGGKRLMKLGRAADVWSLGCILYQMVYGGAPFSHLRDIAIKIAAISSPSTRISFPEYAVPIGKRGEDLSEHKFHVGPDLLTTLKSCLRFDPKQRASIPELLEQPFLRRTSGSSARTDLPYISNGIMDAIVRRVSDKVRGPRSPLSEVDIMDLAQELMSEVWNVQDTLPR